MSIIYYISIPSNPTYGFEDVSQEEFQIWQTNLAEILSKTSLNYIQEVCPNTNLSTYLWATADPSEFYVTFGSWIEIKPKDDGAIAVDLTDRLDNELISTDLFRFPSDSEIKAMVKKIQSWLG